MTNIRESLPTSYIMLAPGKNGVLASATRQSNMPDRKDLEEMLPSADAIDEHIKRFTRQTSDFNLTTHGMQSNYLQVMPDAVATLRALNTLHQKFQMEVVFHSSEPLTEQLIIWHALKREISRYNSQTSASEQISLPTVKCIAVPLQHSEDTRGNHYLADNGTDIIEYQATSPDTNKSELRKALKTHLKYTENAQHLVLDVTDAVIQKASEEGYLASFINSSESIHHPEKVTLLAALQQTLAIEQEKLRFAIQRCLQEEAFAATLQEAGINEASAQRFKNAAILSWLLTIDGAVELKAAKFTIEEAEQFANADVFQQWYNSTKEIPCEEAAQFVNAQVFSAWAFLDAETRVFFPARKIAGINHLALFQQVVSQAAKSMITQQRMTIEKIQQFANADVLKNILTNTDAQIAVFSIPALITLEQASQFTNVKIFEALCSDLGREALQKRLIDVDQVLDLAINDIALFNLLCSPAGLTALARKDITLETACRFNFINSLQALLEHENGIQILLSAGLKWEDVTTISDPAFIHLLLSPLCLASLCNKAVTKKDIQRINDIELLTWLFSTDRMDLLVKLKDVCNAKPALREILLSPQGLHALQKDILTIEQAFLFKNPLVLKTWIESSVLQEAFQKRQLSVSVLFNCTNLALVDAIFNNSELEQTITEKINIKDALAFTDIGALEIWLSQPSFMALQDAQKFKSGAVLKKLMQLEKEGFALQFSTQPEKAKPLTDHWLEISEVAQLKSEKALNLVIDVLSISFAIREGFRFKWLDTLSLLDLLKTHPKVSEYKENHLKAVKLLPFFEKAFEKYRRSIEPSAAPSLLQRHGERGIFRVKQLIHCLCVGEFYAIHDFFTDQLAIIEEAASSIKDEDFLAKTNEHARASISILPGKTRCSEGSFIAFLLNEIKADWGAKYLLGLQQMDKTLDYCDEQVDNTVRRQAIDKIKIATADISYQPATPAVGSL